MVSDLFDCLQLIPSIDWCCLLLSLLLLLLSLLLLPLAAAGGAPQGDGVGLQGFGRGAGGFQGVGGAGVNLVHELPLLVVLSVPGGPIDGRPTNRV